MSAHIPESLAAPFARIRRAAQRRAAAIVVLCSLPVTIGAAALAKVLAGPRVALGIVIIVLVVVAVIATRRMRWYGIDWLLRQLDRHFPAFEDSSALIVGNARSPLQALQQSRITARMVLELHGGEAPDFRPPYPLHVLKRSLLAGVSLIGIAVVMPALHKLLPNPAVATAAVTAPAKPAGLIDTAIAITPPAYTGLPDQTATTLDAKAAVDSQLEWRLRFDHDPHDAALVFHDGTRLPLRQEGRAWVAAMTLTASTLYRLELDGHEPAPGERLSRLDALPDQPPEIIVRAPEKTLIVLGEAQKTWDFAFEARDDYGLDRAEMTVTLAQGSGEQIKVSEQTMVLEGGHDRHARSYRKRLDLAALGYAQGDDLIVKLAVTDNHPGMPNRSVSASYILRWPAAKTTESAGLEGLVQKTLPAYFRSERQIIIDTEALQAQRGALAEALFAKQSDDLGVDQKVLRLRYGQFLGEGFESLAEHAPADANAAKPSAPAATADAQLPSSSLKDIPPEAAAAPATARNGLGQSEDVLHEFGHAHDNGEAATLLDPETRRILKAALDEMWQAELHLRQAQPDAALPYEYKALDYIKQVQQAERIYLERAGLELPSVDLSRRLSGTRAGLEDRHQTAAAADGDGSPAVAVWSALDQGRPPDIAALTAWLRAHPDAVADPLGLAAAADSLQRAPDCARCRAELQAKLWPLLPATAAGVRARRLPDAAGAAYLDALKAGAVP